MNHFDAATKEGLEKLKKINGALNEFASLKPGESAEWHFDANSVEKVPNRFNPQQERIRFKIYDPELEAERTWDASVGAARRVITEMQKGKFFLKIQRTGEGKDTRYQVTPVEPAQEGQAGLDAVTQDESGGELE